MIWQLLRVSEMMNQLTLLSMTLRTLVAFFGSLAPQFPIYFEYFIANLVGKLNGALDNHVLSTSTFSSSSTTNSDDEMRRLANSRCRRMRGILVRCGVDWALEGEESGGAENADGTTTASTSDSQLLHTSVHSISISALLDHKPVVSPQIRKQSRVSFEQCHLYLSTLREVLRNRASMLSECFRLFDCQLETSDLVQDIVCMCCRLNLLWCSQHFLHLFPPHFAPISFRIYAISSSDFFYLHVFVLVS